MKSIVSAIEYMHRNDILHRDLKPDNILIGNSNNFSSVKLIDFGLSIVNSNDCIIYDYCGTIKFMAPEQIDQKMYNKVSRKWY